MKKTTKSVTALLTYSRRSLIFVWILFLWGAVACETVVEVDILQEPSKLVVNSLMRTDQPVSAQVSLSKSVLDNSDLSSVAGAEVVLLEEGTVVATLEENENTSISGFYTSSFLPTAGNNYTLQVGKSGYESVEANAYIPPPIPIQSISYDTSVFINTYQDGDTTIVDRAINIDEIRLTFNDPAGEKNYYEIGLLRYSTQYIYQHDEQGNIVFDSLNNPVIIDSTQNLFPGRLASDDPLLNSGDSFLEDGGSVYNSYFTFSDDFINGKSYTFRFQPDGDFFHNQSDENRYVVTLHTISEEQYLYFNSSDLQNETVGNPFAEPTPVYNNVENGFGIFAGYSSDQVTLEFE